MARNIHSLSIMCMATLCICYIRFGCRFPNHHYTNKVVNPSLGESRLHVNWLTQTIGHSRYMVNADSFVVHRPHIKGKARLAFNADKSGVEEQLPSKIDGACLRTVQVTK